MLESSYLFLSFLRSIWKKSMFVDTECQQVAVIFNMDTYEGKFTIWLPPFSMPEISVPPQKCFVITDVNNFFTITADRLLLLKPFSLGSNNFHYTWHLSQHHYYSCYPVLCQFYYCFVTKLQWCSRQLLLDEHIASHPKRSDISTLVQDSALAAWLTMMLTGREIVIKIISLIKITNTPSNEVAAKVQKYFCCCGAPNN